MRRNELFATLLAVIPVLGWTSEPPESREPDDRRWTVHMDNDLFAFADRDRDYTAGIAFTLGGESAKAHPLSLSGALERADRTTRFSSLFDDAVTEAHAFELGLLLFTPQDLGAEHALVDDRPYANLVYASRSRLMLDAGRNVAYQSSLTLGFLGLPVAERLHRAVHQVFGSDEPLGYAHQISDGGEPTARYAVSRQRLLASGAYRGHPHSLRFGIGASVGYLTEAGAELAFRAGRSREPWWSAPPVSSDYAGHPSIRAARAAAHTDSMDLTFDAGIKARARLYNGFLQGQFRDSDVTYASSQLDHLLFEVWLGVTTVLKNGLSVSYMVRYQSEEIEDGRGARDLTWASIGVAQRF
jgi:hypothetical protein